ncbi:MAG: hypothetical protein ACTSUO_00700 [Candidatus Thorarchaeota archaeon]
MGMTRSIIMITTSLFKTMIGLQKMALSENEDLAGTMRERVVGISRRISDKFQYIALAMIASFLGWEFSYQVLGSLLKLQR